jgi:hypothetical protein
MKIMEHSERAELLKKLTKSDFENANGAPANFWQLTPNYPGQPAGSMWVTLPFTGNLWLYYGFNSTPASLIEIWHQGGGVTPIPVGQSTIQVNAQDLIYYIADGISIKLAYQYV